jgi:hypothetical protein
MLKKNGWRQILKGGAVSVALTAMAAAAAPGCLDYPIAPLEPRTTTTIVERLTQSSVDKIDLLLVIDNSRSMADKQEILRLAVPDLVEQLINPKCVLEDGSEATTQPSSPLEDCPNSASKREFEPILNIHIGVVTSSLGGHGADSCSGQSDASENDKGQLITRQTTGVTPGVVPTYQGLGFLVWDPDPNSPTHDPQGETSATNLINNLGLLVAGAGEVGCGFEATLEAWYRFLVDPDPYETVEVESQVAILKGTDGVLLTQRKNFLRPDSLLAVIMLTDENDCSTRDGGQYYFAGQIYSPGTTQQYHLPKARPECATNPNDPCCRSCGQSQDGCPDASAHCDANSDGKVDVLSNLDDAINLRCFDQKRRFGIDFLYPTDRYVDGVSLPQVYDRNGNVQSNPLFVDLDPTDDISNVRDAGLVFVAGIVGVPWQDIARKNANGQPDLLNGCSGPCDEPGSQVGGFQNAAEMLANGTWDLILGDPSCYHTDAGCLPNDPLMIESVEPRSGVHPVTGDPIAQPGNPAGNGVNGSEYDIPQRDDLQYACIFDLATPRDCSAAGASESCDCKGANVPDDLNQNPLCWNGTAFTNLQTGAKGYPGIRMLQVLRRIGDQGIVGSICPEQQSDPSLFNFGYRPAIGAIVERLKLALGGQCLPRSLTPNAEGQVDCVIIEAAINNDCAAQCNRPGHEPIDKNDPAVKAAEKDSANPGWNCFCKITQLSDAELVTCQNDPGENLGIDGWCYVDAASVPPTGNPEIVANCPATEQRIIRFVGEGQGATGATLFITCTGE